MWDGIYNIDMQHRLLRIDGHLHSHDHFALRGGALKATVVTGTLGATTVGCTRTLHGSELNLKWAMRLTDETSARYHGTRYAQVQWLPT